MHIFPLILHQFTPTLLRFTLSFILVPATVSILIISRLPQFIILSPYFKRAFSCRCHSGLTSLALERKLASKFSRLVVIGIIIDNMCGKMFLSQQALLSRHIETLDKKFLFLFFNTGGQSCSLYLWRLFYCLTTV